MEIEIELYKAMKEKILELYKEGNDLVRLALEEKFGADFFKEHKKDITERIKKFEDALQEVWETRPEVWDEWELIEKLQGEATRSLVAYFKLGVITEALNEGWTPNWNDTTQKKWYPWFYIVGGSADNGAYAGLGDVISAYGAADSDSYLGSRLCCCSEKIATYAGTQFRELYQDFYLG